MGIIRRFAEMLGEAWGRVRLPRDLDVSQRAQRRRTGSDRHRPSQPFRPSSWSPAKPTWSSFRERERKSSPHMLAAELTQRFRAWLFDADHEPDVWSDCEEGKEGLREQVRDKVEEFLASLAAEDPGQEEHYDIYMEVLTVYCEQMDYFDSIYTASENDDSDEDDEDDDQSHPGISWHQRRVG